MTDVYAEFDDMEARFGAAEMAQIAPDAALLAQALADASGEIEATMAGLGKALKAPWPRIVVTICCNLARWYLYEDQVPDEVEKRAEVMRKLLREIGKGALSLPAASLEDLEDDDKPPARGAIETGRPLMQWP